MGDVFGSIRRPFQPRRHHPQRSQRYGRWRRRPADRADRDLMLGSGGWSTVPGLVGGVAAMSVLSAVRPALSYGLVAVTMLVLAPGVEVVEGSLMKAGEIALGTLCGAAAVNRPAKLNFTRRKTRLRRQAYRRRGAGGTEAYPQVSRTVERG